MIIQLTVNRSAGRIARIKVADAGHPFDLTGWSVDLLDVPAELASFVTTVISDAAGGEVRLRLDPGASVRSYRFWVRLTPTDPLEVVETIDIRLTVQ